MIGLVSWGMWAGLEYGKWGTEMGYGGTSDLQLAPRQRQRRAVGSGGGASVLRMGYAMPGSDLGYGGGWQVVSFLAASGISTLVGSGVCCAGLGVGCGVMTFGVGVQGDGTRAARGLSDGGADGRGDVGDGRHVVQQDGACERVGRGQPRLGRERGASDPMMLGIRSPMPATHRARRDGTRCWWSGTGGCRWRGS